MKGQIYRIGLAGLVLAVLGTSHPAFASDAVPLKGTTRGAISAIGFSFPFATFHTEGVGISTQLGQFTLSGQLVIDVTSGSAVGLLELRAANGDTLTLTLEGDTLDAFHGIGHFTIVGGTGRFQAAVGSYTDYITFALPVGSTPNPYSSGFVGSISSIGPGK